jgi:hypothetical protein
LPQTEGELCTMQKLAFLFAFAIVLAINHSAACSPAAVYGVGGLALGAKVGFGGAAYREYQCVRSEKFDGFVWCAKTTSDKEVRGPFKVWSSMMHAQNGMVVYVNRYQEPAYWGASEVSDDIRRYSLKIGEEPHIIHMPVRPGLPNGTLATWGKVVLEPIVGDELRLLGEGKPLSKGIAIDFIGDFTRSARQGLPVYRIEGGAGFVWAASYDEKGRGTLRSSAVDASAYSHATMEGTPAASADNNARRKEVTPAFAASAVELFKNRVIAAGGCQQIARFYGPPYSQPTFTKRPERLDEASFYGKPLLDWSDGEIAETIQFYKDCLAGTSKN